PGEFRPSSSLAPAAPARRVLTLVVACATAWPLGRLPPFASSSHLRRPAPLRESSVAGSRSHLPPHCYRFALQRRCFAPPRWPPQISCYHCAASASASDQPLRAAEVAPLSPLQPLRTAHLITRRSSRAQRLRQRSPHRPLRLHSRAPPSRLHATAQCPAPSFSSVRRTSPLLASSKP
ncbi:hypothetical protein U1Q18_037407, partial [Sarracenia purpurea var. burkii]